MKAFNKVGLFLARHILVITDKAESTLPCRYEPNVLFVCFDHEVKRKLQGQGYQIAPFDLPLHQYADYEHFYAHYEGLAVKNRRSAIHDSLSDIITQQLAMRTVELYAPIMHIWDCIVSAVNRNPRATVITDIADPWLQTIVDELLSPEPTES